MHHQGSSSVRAQHSQHLVYCGTRICVLDTELTAGQIDRSICNRQALGTDTPVEIDASSPGWRWIRNPIEVNRSQIDRDNVWKSLQIAVRTFSDSSRQGPAARPDIEYPTTPVDTPEVRIPPCGYLATIRGPE